jgi:eukaryotic-like serine/threonine-protein kinase
MTDMRPAFERVSGALSSAYRIERELGRGGMATVYLAEDLKHHRRVAVKVLHPELAATLGHDRFLREVEIAARLQHPHILTLIDSGEADGLLYYVMPFVDGASLRARLAREHELPVADVVRIMREVADALSEAHALGVVHRDIKPDNVLLRGQHAVITDFGIAKAVSEATGVHALTSVGVTLGTPTYMAPEQAAGETADHRADIYALGVMAYEMLTGAPPFAGTTAQAVLTAHLAQQPEPIASRRAEVPAPLAAVVMRCLEKNPADRWRSVNDLLAELDAVSTPGGGVFPLSPVSTRASGSRTSPTRNRLLALVAVLAVVAAVAGYALRNRGSAGAGNRTRSPTVAVLPFENLGAPNDEYFADGMTDELTGRLGKLAGLGVIARTSAIQYKKTTKAITQIAKELGADFLVEGTVRWEKTADGAGRVLVTPQVIRARDGTQVWTGRFDKPYGTDVFAIQSDIAEHVARAMDVTLNPGDRPAVREVPTTNLAAYDAYLRAQATLGRDFGQNWEAQRQALESLEQAVRLDPRFPAAQARLGWVHARMADNGYDMSLGTGVTTEQRWEMARAAVERALAVDSLSAVAHAVLARYYWRIARDTGRAGAELALAQRSEPGSRETMEGTVWLADVGRRKEALRELEQAAALDPRNAERWTSIAVMHDVARELPAAQAALERASAIAPAEASLYVVRAWLYLKQDRRDSARAILREGIAQAGVNSVLFQMAQNTAWVNMIRILHDEIGESAARLTWKEFGADSIDYYTAKALAYEMGSARSRAYFDSLAVWSAPRVKLPTRDPFYKLERAYGLAGAGRRDEAARALRLIDSAGTFALNNGDLIVQAAQACVMMGDLDRAVGYIASALADSIIPPYTPAIFRLDPIWDPLRGRADFRKLVAQR